MVLPVVPSHVMAPADAMPLPVKVEVAEQQWGLLIALTW